MRYNVVAATTKRRKGSGISRPARSSVTNPKVIAPKKHISFKRKVVEAPEEPIPKTDSTSSKQVTRYPIKMKKSLKRSKSSHNGEEN